MERRPSRCAGIIGVISGYVIGYLLLRFGFPPELKIAPFWLGVSKSLFGIMPSNPQNIGIMPKRKVIALHSFDCTFAVLR